MFHETSLLLTRSTRSVHKEILTDNLWQGFDTRGVVFEHLIRKFIAKYPVEWVVTFYTQLFDGEDTVSRNSAAMCTSVCPVSLLAVVVVAWVVHPAPVVCQCTTGHCHDNGDNDVSVLTAMVSRLQDTVEQLQQQLKDTTDRLDKQEECTYALFAIIALAK